VQSPVLPLALTPQRRDRSSWANWFVPELRLVRASAAKVKCPWERLPRLVVSPAYASPMGLVFRTNDVPKREPADPEPTP